MYGTKMERWMGVANKGRGSSVERVGGGLLTGVFGSAYVRRNVWRVCRANSRDARGGTRAR